MPSLFCAILALWLFLSAIVPAALADDTHISCASGTEIQPDFNWWNNKHGENPCQMLQNLLRGCDPDHTIQMMPQSPLKSPDICEANPNSDNSFIPCCCNTVAYALREACWSCQQGKAHPDAPHRRPTFAEYLRCPGTVPNTKELFKNVSAPPWTALRIDPDGTWNLTMARVFAVETSHMHMMETNPPDDSSPSNNSSASTSSSITVAEAAVMGVLAGLGTVVLALASIVWIQRCRRVRKRKVVPEWCQRMQGQWGDGGPSSQAGNACPYATAPQPHAFSATTAPQSAPEYTVNFQKEETGYGLPIHLPRSREQQSKLQRILGAKSWLSTLAREPDIPQPPDDVSEKDVEFDAAMREAGTKKMNLTDARAASGAWTPIARMTPSMTMSRSMRSYLPQPEISSIASTHTFSI